MAEAATALRQATGRIDDELRQGFTPDANNVDRWLQIAVIGADPARAAELGARIEAGIDGFSERSEAVAWYVAGVLALLRGRADAAHAAATALTQWLDAPATSPRTVAGFGALGELIAVAGRIDASPEPGDHPKDLGPLGVLDGRSLAPPVTAWSSTPSTPERRPTIWRRARVPPGRSLRHALSHDVLARVAHLGCSLSSRRRSQWTPTSW